MCGADMLGILGYVFKFSYRCLDDASIKNQKMYASSKKTIKNSCSDAGINLEFQASLLSDMNYDDFAAEVERKA